MEEESKIKHKRERDRDRGEKTEKYQAHRVEATRKSPRSSKTVMKRTASLRFAALAPQWVGGKKPLIGCCYLYRVGI